ANVRAAAHQARRASGGKGSVRGQGHPPSTGGPRPERRAVPVEDPRRFDQQMAALISHSRDYFERRGRDALQAPLNTSSGQPIWTQQQQQYAMQMRHRAVELGLQPGAASASGSGDWGRGMGRGGGSARGGRGSQQPAAQSGARYAGRLAEAMAKQAPNVAALQASAELAHTERVMHRLAQQAAAATGMPPASSLAPPSRTPAAYQAATPSAVLGQPPRMPSAAQLMAMMRGVTYSEEEKERSAQRTSLQLAAAAYMHRVADQKRSTRERQGAGTPHSTPHFARPAGAGAAVTISASHSTGTGKRSAGKASSSASGMEPAQHLSGRVAPPRPAQEAFPHNPVSVALACPPQKLTVPPPPTPSTAWMVPPKPPAKHSLPPPPPPAAMWEVPPQPHVKRSVPATPSPSTPGALPQPAAKHFVPPPPPPASSIRAVPPPPPAKITVPPPPAIHEMPPSPVVQVPPPPPTASISPPAQKPAAASLQTRQPREAWTAVHRGTPQARLSAAQGEVAGEIVKGKPDVSTRGGEMATSSSRVLPNDAAGKEALCDVKKAAEPSPLGHAVASTRTTSAAPVKAVGTAKGNAAGRGRGARARPVASSPADHGAGGDASTSSQSGDAAALAEVRRKQAAGGTLTEPERWLLRSERFAKKPEAKSKKTVVLKGSKPTVPVGSASIPSTPAAQEATPMAPKDRPPEDFQVKSFEEIMAEKRKRKAEAAAN
ncbi:hypothetical protein CYMTET_36406, partial [Cymbomonas tetramitiformis]